MHCFSNFFRMFVLSIENYTVECLFGSIYQKICSPLCTDAAKKHNSIVYECRFFVTRLSVLMRSLCLLTRLFSILSYVDASIICWLYFYIFCFDFQHFFYKEMIKTSKLSMDEKKRPYRTTFGLMYSSHRNIRANPLINPLEMCMKFKIVQTYRKPN